MKTLSLIACTLLFSILFYSCDKNEFAPVVVDQEFTIEENSPKGTLIGAVEASDADEDQRISFEITDGNLDNTFKIDPNNGIISVVSPTKLNYEENTEFIISVSVTDSHDKDPLETSATVKINITDMNEFAPSIIDQGFSLKENPLNGQEIGQIQATDGDIFQSLSFSIDESSDQGFLNIDSQTGVLSVVDSSGFDYESTKLMTIVVKVVDNHTNQREGTATVSITIEDVGTSYSLVLQPGPEEGKDAFTEDYPDGNYNIRNFGDSEELSAIAWTASGKPLVIRSFIEFDMLSIPENAVIDSAMVSLYSHGNIAHGDGHAALSGSNEFTFQRILSYWDEHMITWNNQPETTTLNRIELPASASQYQDYNRMDITDLAKVLHENPSQNFGFMIALKLEEEFRRVFFASSDIPEENRRPKLEVYYTVE